MGRRRQELAVARFKCPSAIDGTTGAICTRRSPVSARRPLIDDRQTRPHSKKSVPVSPSSPTAPTGQQGCWPYCALAAAVAGVALGCSMAVVSCSDQSMDLFALARTKAPSVRRNIRCRKGGERCHKIKAKIAKFSANQMPISSVLTIFEGLGFPVGLGRRPRPNRNRWNRACLTRVLAITDGGTPSREGGFQHPARKPVPCRPVRPTFHATASSRSRRSVPPDLLTPPTAGGRRSLVIALSGGDGGLRLFHGIPLA